MDLLVSIKKIWHTLSDRTSNWIFLRRRIIPWICKAIAAILVSNTLYSCGFNDDLSLKGVELQTPYVYQDTSNSLELDHILKPDIQKKFEFVTDKNIRFLNSNSTYWYKFSIIDSSKSSLLFLESHSTFASIELFSPSDSGTFIKQVGGTTTMFKDRRLQYKRFLFGVPVADSLSPYYYAKLKIKDPEYVNFTPYPYDHFFNKALGQYFYYGLFYGILTIILMCSVVFYAMLKDRTFLFYGFFVLSLTAYSLVYWDLLHTINFYAYFSRNNYLYNIPYVSMTIFFLAYSNEILSDGAGSGIQKKIIPALIVFRIISMVLAVLFNIDILTVNYIDFSLLLVCYLLGLSQWKSGNMQATYLVLGQTIFFIGISIHTLRVSSSLLHPSSFLHHPFFSFLNLAIYEIMFFSISLAVRWRRLRNDKDEAMKKIIHHLKEIELIKDRVNKELEVEVQKRTEKIEEQSRQIQQMNELLNLDKKKLERNVKTISKARVMQQELSLEEFKQVFPDENPCYEYLSNLKWQNGYTCRNCKNTHFFSGKLPYSRRCSKCKYEESVTVDTLFHKLRFSIVKAFYIVFQVSDNPKITTTALAASVDLSIETCWAYRKKVLSVMEAIKTKKKKLIWSDLLLIPPPVKNDDLNNENLTSA